MAHIWPTLHKIKGPLTIVCRQCAHRAVWSREKAIVNLGAASLPHQVREKLRCSMCKARGRDHQIAVDAAM
jgi:hypothetical protein